MTARSEDRSATRFIDTLPKKDRARLCPSEAQEQAAVCRWLDLNGVTYFAVPNGTYKAGKASRGIHKATGLKSGVPDIIIVDRPTKCHLPEGHAPHPPGAGHRGKTCGLSAPAVAVEMKRMVGGRLSPEQRGWLEKLDQLGWIALVANGYDHAIAQLTALGYARRTT